MQPQRIPAILPRWPRLLPFKNEDGSWTLEWDRWFSLLDRMVNATAQIPITPFLATSPKASEGGSELGLSASVGRRYGQPADAFPPVTQKRLADSPFPPQSRHSVADSPLALLAALGPQRQVIPVTIRDTHSNRASYPVSAFPVGALFAESDRLVIYQNTGSAWVYLAGQYDAVLSSIPTLGTDDTGYLFGVTDYSHVLRWTGSAWGFAPGDGGSGMLALFEVDPGTGWHLYDGATVNYLKADGTTGSVTLPDLASTAAYLKAGSPNSGPNAAVAPTFTGTPAVLTGSVAAPVFTGTAIPLTSSTFTPVALATAAITSVGGSATTFTPAGTNSAPALTMNSYTPAGTNGTNGEPRNLVLRPFFRI